MDNEKSLSLVLFISKEKAAAVEERIEKLGIIVTYKRMDNEGILFLVTTTLSNITTLREEFDNIKTTIDTENIVIDD